MKSLLALILLALVLCCASCSWIPSGLRIGGTPIDKAKKADEKEASAKGDVVGGAQAASHKVVAALEAAPDSRPVEVARDFAKEAAALLDQAHGAPNAADSAAWQKLVTDLLSDNVKVREAAERQRAKDADATAHLADRLTAATLSSQQWHAKAMTYAADADDKADVLRKFVFWGGVLVVLWLLSQVLKVGANFIPALAPAAAVFNGVVAPAVQYAAGRAQQGLSRVGTALAEMRAKAPDLAAQATAYLDDALDHAHKAVVSSGAAAAGSPDPQTKGVAS